jgi:hypothetical protein
MPGLEVVFDVPEQLALGLASGSLQRVGGVIVDSGSKQVVAWLRDGSIDRVLDDGGLLTPLLAGLAASKAGTALATFTAGGLVLNLALAAVSFREIVQRLDRLSAAVNQLGEELRAEFARERDMRFRVALQAARDVFEGENLDNRDNAMRSAVDGLYAARENFLDEFNRLLNQSDHGQMLIAAYHMLIRALYAEVSRIRCYLAGEDIELAKLRINEDMPRFAQYTKQLISRLMGDHPAIYLHQVIETPDAARFLRVQRWLRTDDLRADFWKPDVVNLIEDEYGFPRRIVKTTAEKVEGLVNRLNQAVILIENYERLLGFEMELREFRLASGAHSFQEWSRLVDEEKLKEYGIGIIVDRERLERLSI